MREKEIEKRFRLWAESQGGRSLKLHLMSLIGFPDRTVLMPGGVIAFMEFKKPGGVESPQQQWWIEQLLGLGFFAGFVYSFDDAKTLIQLAGWTVEREFGSKSGL